MEDASVSRPLEDNPHVSLGYPPKKRIPTQRRRWRSPVTWRGIKEFFLVILGISIFALGPINIAMVFIDPFIGLMMFPVTGWLWLPAWITWIGRKRGWGL